MEKPSLRYSREGRLSSFEDSHAAKVGVAKIVALLLGYSSQVASHLPIERDSNRDLLRIAPNTRFAGSCGNDWFLLNPTTDR
jgi:hypothetical protein